jgi:hypothetical protein
VKKIGLTDGRDSWQSVEYPVRIRAPDDIDSLKRLRRCAAVSGCRLAASSIPTLTRLPSSTLTGTVYDTELVARIARAWVYLGPLSRQIVPVVARDMWTVRIPPTLPSAQLARRVVGNTCFPARPKRFARTVEQMPTGRAPPYVMDTYLPGGRGERLSARGDCERIHFIRVRPSIGWISTNWLEGSGRTRSISTRRYDLSLDFFRRFESRASRTSYVGISQSSLRTFFNAEGASIKNVKYAPVVRGGGGGGGGVVAHG